MKNSISLEEYKLLPAGSYQLIDIRGEEEIAHGAIPGAAAIPQDALLENEQLDRTKKQVICCSRGKFSVEAAEELAEAGYDAVSLEGGYIAWLLDTVKQQEAEEKLSGIRGEVTDIGWGNQIRSYVLQPYTMVKDHRTGVESGIVDSILDGNLDPFINGYLKWIALGGKQPENATEEME